MIGQPTDIIGQNEPAKFLKIALFFHIFVPNLQSQAKVTAVLLFRGVIE